MDSDEFRAILSRSGAGIWPMIEAAIRVASSDYGDELRRRRDGIVELLYAPPAQLCQNCSGVVNNAVDRDDRFYNRGDNINNSSDDVYYKDDHHEKNKEVDVEEYKVDGDLNKNFSRSPLTPESNHRNFSVGRDEEEDLDPYGGLFDDEQTTILSIKEQLEDPHQSEEDVVELLQNLADMDITFQALKETDIGRHVNRLRKHQSPEVRRLVKQLVRKWKETVDEWVKVNKQQGNSDLIADVDSPQQSIPKNQQNGHHQVPDFGYSPNPTNRSSSSERYHVEHEAKPRPSPSATRRETPSRPPQSVPRSSPAPPPPKREQKDSGLDDERLNSARKRLHENYQEAENAKKQRTIQVVDIHDLPRPKKGFFPKNRGGFHGRSSR